MKLDKTIRKAQDELRGEFCKAYCLDKNQIGFAGDSLDPIFDFDALSVLSARLCSLPHIAVELGDVDANTGIAVSNGYAVLENQTTRKIYGMAQVGEILHDGTQVEDIRQAVILSRARAMRTIHRMVGFDPVRAHREFKQTGHVVEMSARSPKDQRKSELAEIHLLAQGLGLRTRLPGGMENRQKYDTLLATFFPRPQWQSNQPSSAHLDDKERASWLFMLRAWSRAQAVAKHNNVNAA